MLSDLDLLIPKHKKKYLVQFKKKIVSSNLPGKKI